MGEGDASCGALAGPVSPLRSRPAIIALPRALVEGDAPPSPASAVHHRTTQGAGGRRCSWREARGGLVFPLKSRARIIALLRALAEGDADSISAPEGAGRGRCFHLVLGQPRSSRVRARSSRPCGLPRRPKGGRRRFSSEPPPTRAGAPRASRYACPRARHPASCRHRRPAGPRRRCAGDPEALAAATSIYLLNRFRAKPPWSRAWNSLAVTAAR